MLVGVFSCFAEGESFRQNLFDKTKICDKISGVKDFCPELDF